MTTIIDAAYLAAEARGHRIIPVSEVDQVVAFDVVCKNRRTHVKLPRRYRKKLKRLLKHLERMNWPDCALTDITMSIKLRRFPKKHYVFIRETRAVYSDETGTGFTSQGELFDFNVLVNPNDLDPSTRDSLMVTIDDMLYRYGLSDD